MDEKERANRRLVILPPLLGALFMILALTGGTLVSLHKERPAAEPEPTAKVIVVPARTPGVTVAPTVNSITLSAFGGNIGPDVFTAYVGDKFVLTAEIDPTYINPPVRWSFSDPASVILTPGDNRLTCTFNVQKPSGKNELTVSCYGTELVIPVYLWER